MFFKYDIKVVRAAGVSRLYSGGAVADPLAQIFIFSFLCCTEFVALPAGDRSSLLREVDGDAPFDC